MTHAQELAADAAYDVAEEAGYQACRAGAPQANPHAPSEPGHRPWAAGWERRGRDLPLTAEERATLAVLDQLST